MWARGWVAGCLLLVGFSVAAFSGPLSGQWNVWGRLEYGGNEAVLLMDFESLLQIDYTTCGWTFTGSALLSKHDFEYLWFTAGGSLGAIDFYSALTFGFPSMCFFFGPIWAPLGIGTMDTNGTTLPTMDFVSWISSARMSIAGLDLFGIFAVLKEGSKTNHIAHVSRFSPKNGNNLHLTRAVGSGFILGGSGSAGDCDLCVQVGFNLWRFYRGRAAPACVCHYGWDWIVPSFAPIHCCDRWMGPECWWWVNPTCCLPFSWAEIYLEQSFACFDLTIDVLFSCDYGFDSVSFALCDICLGLPWLELGALEVVFSRALGGNCALEGSYQKYVLGEFDLVVADCVCFTPYLFLEVDNVFELDGIGLAALTVEYDIGQGVTFKAGDLFFRYHSWRDRQDCQPVWVTAFTETGDVVEWTEDMYCEPCLMPWDEYIGFMIDGDSCCSGHFDAWIFTWFDTGTTVVASALDAIGPMDVTPTPAFMDWAETRVKLDVDIGTNLTLMLKMSLDGQGLNWLRLGAETRW